MSCVFTMAKTRFSFIVLSLILLSVAFSITNVQGTMTSPIEEELTAEVIHVGAPAINWHLKEITSDVNRSFSSFTGKVVLMDFFATWCDPCIDALPDLSYIKDYFLFDSRFKIMSIAVDLADSELEAFADKYNINWMIFRGTVAMDSYYEIMFIPTLIIVNPSQFVAYTEIGLDSRDNIISVIEDLLAENDTTAPLITSLETNRDALSVKNNDLTISVNITDENLRYVKYKITIGDSEIFHEEYAPEVDIINQNFIIDPTIIEAEMSNGATNVTIEIIAEDFSKNSAIETIILLLEIDEVGLSFTTVLALVFLSGIIIVPLSRYFSKKKGT